MSTYIPYALLRIVLFAMHTGKISTLNLNTLYMLWLTMTNSFILIFSIKNNKYV